MSPEQAAYSAWHAYQVKQRAADQRLRDRADRSYALLLDIAATEIDLGINATAVRKLHAVVADWQRRAIIAGLL